MEEKTTYRQITHKPSTKHGLTHQLLLVQPPRAASGPPTVGYPPTAVGNGPTAVRGLSTADFQTKRSVRTTERQQRTTDSKSKAKANMRGQTTQQATHTEVQNPPVRPLSNVHTAPNLLENATGASLICSLPGHTVQLDIWYLYFGQAVSWPGILRDFDFDGRDR